MANEAVSEKPSSNKWLKIALLAAGVLAALVVVALLVGGLQGGEPDPNEMARDYIEGNIDKLGEDVAGFVVGDNWLLKELGGEYVEDRVNDVVHWSYSPARLVSEGEYRVTATASVEFNVDYDVLGRTYSIVASLPFDLTVRPADDTVSGMPDYAAGRIVHDIPNVPQLPSAGEAMEKAEEAAEKVDEAKEEAMEKAEEAVEKVDEAKEEAVEKAEEAAEKVDEAKEEAVEKAEEATEKVDEAKEELEDKAGDLLKRLGN